jgi:hypothetical protein
MVKVTIAYAASKGCVFKHEVRFIVEELKSLTYTKPLDLSLCESRSSYYDNYAVNLKLIRLT